MGERGDRRPSGGPVPSEKITAPGPVPSLVARERLYDALDGGPDRPAVLVCAPAGYGKTTLLADWAARTPEAVAWVRLDAGDDDPARLRATIAAALRAAARPPGGGPVPATRSPGDPAPHPRQGSARPDPGRTEAAGAVEWTGASPGGLAGAPGSGEAAGTTERAQASPERAQASLPITLVLDGLEVVTSAAALGELERLLDRPPGGPRVVLSGRGEPPVALYRLRLAGALRELRGDALRFTADEAAVLLRRHGTELGPRELAALLRHTEGWPAALQLAAVALRSAPDPGAYAAGFDGDDRGVADYLVGEVLSRSPPAEREFLLRTSVCERLDADLANALTGRDDAAAALDRLLRTGAPVAREAPGSPWHRCHPLLRAHLYAELRRTRPAEVPRLHGAAADWFAARERPAEALRHAVAVPDPHRVSALLDRHVTRMVTAGQGRTVRRLLAELPEPALESEPGLLLAAALARLDTGDLDNGSRYLALSTRADPHPRDSGVRALRRIVRLERARLAGSLPEALRLAEGLRIPEAADRDGGDDLAALALADRGIVHMELGQLTQGKADLTAALAIARRRGLDHLTAQCLSCLAAVAAAECRNTRAVRLGEAAADFARARGWEGAALCAPAYEAVAWAELQLTERDPAERWSRLARQSVRSVHGRVDPTVEFGARLVGAVAAYERGERERGLVGLRRAWTACGDRQLMPELSAFGSVAEVQMALAAGRIAWAAEALGRARERLDGSAETAVMEAAVLAARGRDEAARAALRRALDGGRPPVVVSTLVEAWLLEARLCEARGERPRAAQALREAMGIARSRRVLRPFRVGGPGLRQLLIRSLPGLGPLEPFGHELLRVVPDTGAPPPVSALTPRETALLQQLPSLRTMEEIAADLFVSVNTLKTHLRGIYRKLEVGTRRDAVLAAREKGLL